MLSKQSRLRRASTSPQLLVIAACLTAIGVALWLRPLWPRTNAALNPEAVARSVAARGDLADDEKSTIDIYNRTKPAVVHITTLASLQDRFTLNVQEVPQGTGSGFVWDDKGHVVTNYHVIRNAESARVTLADQSNWRARLVGAFPAVDLAVLVIDAPKEKLTAIPIGRSDDLQVGQTVFAIGNPFGLDYTLTKGILSAYGREIESVTGQPMKNLLQTDAAINPGNSGGPLLDSAGRLIGVNVAIRAGAQNIGFAIPVDEVNRIVPELIRNGKVTRPGLGIQVVPDQAARQLVPEHEGILIMRVIPESAAAKAGLHGTTRDRSGWIPGDLITSLDGAPIRNLRDLHEALQKHKIGDTVKLKVWRDGEMIDVDVQLGAID